MLISSDPNNFVPPFSSATLADVAIGWPGSVTNSSTRKVDNGRLTGIYLHNTRYKKVKTGHALKPLKAIFIVSFKLSLKKVSLTALLVSIYCALVKISMNTARC